MKIQLKTQDIAVIGICAALYAVVGRLTAGVTFLGVGFLPAVVIPAVFAVLYGPWVGGISGAIGIFIRDMFVHGNAALSLAAGVPPNFILFFLIGYIAARNIDTKKITVALVLSAAVIVAGLLVPTLIYPAEFSALTGLTTTEILLVFGLTVVLSFVVISCRGYSLETMEKLCYCSCRWASSRSRLTFRYSMGGQSTFPFLLQIACRSHLYSSTVCLDFRH